MHRLAVLLCGGIIACSNTDIRRMEEALKSTGKNQWLGFTPYPRARELCCCQRVYGVSGEEINWSSYATADRVEDVVSFYGRSDDAQPSGDEGSFRLTGAGNRRMSVHAASGQYPKCDKSPRLHEQTVILVSEMFSKQ